MEDTTPMATAFVQRAGKQTLMGRKTNNISNNTNTNTTTNHNNTNKPRAPTLSKTKAARPPRWKSPPIDSPVPAHSPAPGSSSTHHSPPRPPRLRCYHYRHHRCCFRRHYRYLHYYRHPPLPWRRRRLHLSYAPTPGFMRTRGGAGWMHAHTGRFLYRSC